MKKWTIKQVEEHLRTNCGNTYSAAVVMAGLFQKLYGERPKMGLSGAQAEFADQVVEKLPEPKHK